MGLTLLKFAIGLPGNSFAATLLLNFAVARLTTSSGPLYLAHLPKLPRQEFDSTTSVAYHKINCVGLDLLMVDLIVCSGVLSPARVHVVGQMFVCARAEATNCVRKCAPRCRGGVDLRAFP